MHYFFPSIGDIDDLHAIILPNNVAPTSTKRRCERPPWPCI